MFQRDDDIDQSPKQTRGSGGTCGISCFKATDLVGLFVTAAWRLACLHLHDIYYTTQKYIYTNKVNFLKMIFIIQMGFFDIRWNNWWKPCMWIFKMLCSQQLKSKNMDSQTLHMKIVMHVGSSSTTWECGANADSQAPPLHFIDIPKCCSTALGRYIFIQKLALIMIEIVTFR